jgi:glycosyltransferase involved in cell wall biosynthesis
VHCQSNLEPEPFGQVFVEALAAGLPVVTTNMGGGREIVTDSCGLRVAAKPSAVAGALARLIDDPVLRASLSRAGPARAFELCDPRVRMVQLEALFADVVRRP